jgi:hypothetical protein
MLDDVRGEEASQRAAELTCPHRYPSSEQMLWRRYKYEVRE